jgi:hypothetical protein
VGHHDTSPSNALPALSPSSYLVTCIGAVTGVTQKELLPGAVRHDKAGVQFLDSPRRREAAARHGSAIPVLFRLAPHRWRSRVLDLQPVRRPPLVLPQATYRSAQTYEGTTWTRLRSSTLACLPGDLAPKEIKRPRQTARTIQPYPRNEWGAPKTLTLLKCIYPRCYPQLGD